MNTTYRLGTLVGASLLLAGLLAGCTTASEPAADDGLAPSATMTTSLPPDFPRAWVPVIAGTVIAASGDATRGWTVAIAPARAQGLARATRALAAAGYLTRSFRSDPAILMGPLYDVRLTDAGGTIVYVVRQR
ncbi:hypothetical protein ASF88_18190 [Leifsonia sp. Leaf336]|uniref:hypothetical protein n=1 Tax=Leifsonia sp. Leaf336 TaxID=1736341 RepID=UPI0007016B60|nr:hypothetical protein [Leifsonia sp. Leaf336]KQR51117.1 hypothetical protein ASF88_18190 [Leifsonia sp. Leaf336]